jgi:hypothetical protein
LVGEVLPTLESPAPAALLEAWDRGARQTPARRALTLLASATPAAQRHGLHTLTVGERDRLLLDVRETLFGGRVVALAECPSCGAALELEFELDEVRGPASPAEQIDVRWSGQTLRVRVPTAGDLADAADAREVSAAHELLVERCLADWRAEADGPDLGASSTTQGDERQPRMSPSLVAAIDRALADADPQADVQLALSCVDCGAAWNAPFDIASFVWAEVEGWAIRSLREVHHLASAYSWSEAEILSLPPSRRRLYMAALGE